MRLLNKGCLAASVAASFLVSFVVPASANLIVNTGNISGGDNVLSVAGCGPTGAPATQITGCLNSNNSTDVIFQSTSNTTQENLNFEAGGQAKLVAAGVADLLNEPTQTQQTWGINNATISLGGGLVFSEIGFNIELFETSNVTFTDNFGESVTLLNVDSSGNNDFTISSTMGDLSWLRIEAGDYTATWKVQGQDHSVTDGDINDIKQVRFDGVKNPPCTDCNTPPSVPEPASLFLLGSALLGYGASRRRKPV